MPSIELDIPFTDDPAVGNGAFGPTLEVGGRLSYDLVDRLISPYVGVHYERKFGETADLARAGGEDAGAGLLRYRRAVYLLICAARQCPSAAGLHSSLDAYIHLHNQMLKLLHEQS